MLLNKDIVQQVFQQIEFELEPGKKLTFCLRRRIPYQNMPVFDREREGKGTYLIEVYRTAILLLKSVEVP